MNPLFLLGNLCIFIVLSVGTFVLFDIRHNFLITQSTMHLFNGQTGFHISIIASIQKALEVFFQEYTGAVFSISSWLAALILLGVFALLIMRARKKAEYRLLLLWIAIPVVVLILLKHDVIGHFYVSLIPAFILITAIGIEAVMKKRLFLGVVIAALLVFAQLWNWHTIIPQNTDIFFQSTQLNLRYSDELATIDNIYKEAGSTSFAFQAYTIPYWSQQGWEYLFWSYGERKYDTKPIDQHDGKKLFVIIQDDTNTQYQQDWLKNTVSKWGKLNNSFRYGILTTRELQF